MDIILTKNDYCQLGIIKPKAMRMLPAHKRGSSQVVAVGDQKGVVQVFGVKDHIAKPIFKNPPENPVTRVELGGSLGQPREKIFVAAKSEVKGFSRKGKQFLQFDTNMTEDIQVMHIEGSELFVGGKYIYQRFTNLKDGDYLLCGDRIKDLLTLPMHKVPAPTPILACSDRVLRVLKGSALQYEVEVAGPPSCLELHIDEGGEHGNEVLYGTSDGKIGFVKLVEFAPYTGWEASNPDSSGGVQCLDHYDMVGDGVPDLIVGRDDGNVEIWSYDDVMEPQLKYTKNSNESISAVQAGRVANPNCDEIVCASHSGWIFGLTTEGLSTAFSANGLALPDEALTAKITLLKEEVNRLQDQVGRERERYQNSAGKKSAMSAVPHFHIQEKFQLNPNEAAYTLSIECVTPIEVVLIQSDAPIDLLDMEKNSAVVSYSHCKPEEENHMLVTYRCQADTTRLELKVRSIEGQYGNLQLYVTPRIQPKVCQLRQFPIKPLSLHKRAHQVDESRPMSVLRLKGSFSLAEMHAWVYFCLPECPERAPTLDNTAADPNVSIMFQSTFLTTQLQCFYRKGEATFRSDNLSTISILKDVISNEATKKKIILNISFDINPSSVEHTLRLIHPKMEELLLLARQVQLIEPLMDICQQEANMDATLSPEYKEILKNAEQLQAAYKRQPCHLERLYGMITDLYIDKFKFQGQNVKNRVPALLAVLDNYDLKELIRFFDSDQ